MTSRPVLSFAALAAISTTLAFAQQTPPAPPPDSQSPPAAPVERRAPSGPGMPGGPRGMAGDHRAGMTHGGGHGAPQEMDGGFHIIPPGMWWRNPALVTKLTLTPAQTKKMDDIFQTSRIQLIDLKANVQKQEVMLEPLLSANPPDMAKAMAQIDKVAQARADLEKADSKMLLGIRMVLTPEQWTMLHAPGGAGRTMGGGRGPGMGGPGGGGSGGGQN